MNVPSTTVPSRVQLDQHLLRHKPLGDARRRCPNMAVCDAGRDVSVVGGNEILLVQPPAGLQDIALCLRVGWDRLLLSYTRLDYTFCCPNSSARLSVYGSRQMPFSVTMAVMRVWSVTSKAGIVAFDLRQRRRLHKKLLLDLLGLPQLNFDVVPRTAIEINGGGRAEDIKRDAVMALPGLQRQRYRSYWRRLRWRPRGRSRQSTRQSSPPS